MPDTKYNRAGQACPPLPHPLSPLSPPEGTARSPQIPPFPPPFGNPGVTILPTFVPRRMVRTIRVAWSLSKSRLTDGALGCFHPHSFPTPPHSSALGGPGSAPVEASPPTGARLGGLDPLGQVRLGRGVSRIATCHFLSFSLKVFVDLQISPGGRYRLLPLTWSRIHSLVRWVLTSVVLRDGLLSADLAVGCPLGVRIDLVPYVQRSIVQGLSSPSCSAAP